MNLPKIFKEEESRFFSKIEKSDELNHCEGISVFSFHWRKRTPEQKQEKREKKRRYRQRKKDENRQYILK